VHLPFTVLDPVLLAGSALMAYHAARQNFVPYLTELVAFGLGLWVALGLFYPIARLAHAGLGVNQGVAGFGAFLLLLVTSHALVQTPVTQGATWLHGHLKLGLSPGMYAVLSAVPALGVAAMTATVLLCSLVVLPLASARSLVTGSLLGSAIVNHAGFVQAPVQRLLVPSSSRPTAGRILESDPVSNPGEDAFYKLQLPPSLSTQVDPPAEALMLQRVNQVRAQNGLSPLRQDTLLLQAAREHSADMYQRRYFSHRTPDGKTPYDRLHDLRIHYVTAGENLAFAPDGDQAWDSLMKSPDHRANILNPDFRCVGIGAYKGLNGYEEMFTQDFADCS
jgi:uncharacterized protein YkwD